jgi:FAD/FMN-containing dehydrogenase
MSDASVDAPDYFAALLKEGRLESIAATAHASQSEAALAPAKSWQRSGSNRTRRVLRTHELEAQEREMPIVHWRTLRNLWCDYCLDAPGFARFARFVDEEVSPILPGHLAYVLCVAPRRGEPLALDMRPPSNQRLFTLGLFFGVPRAATDAIARLEAVHRRALELCLELGGRPYLHGLWGGRGGLSKERLSTIYGDTYRTLHRVRDRVDPLGILSPYALN